MNGLERYGFLIFMVMIGITMIVLTILFLSFGPIENAMPPIEPNIRHMTQSP